MFDEDSSTRSSLEGTPVVLSREGSRIRVIDEETGEIFFSTRPNRSKVYDTQKSEKRIRAPHKINKSINPFEDSDEDESNPFAVLPRGRSRSNLNSKSACSVKGILKNMQMGDDEANIFNDEALVPRANKFRKNSKSPSKNPNSLSRFKTTPSSDLNNNNESRSKSPNMEKLDPDMQATRSAIAKRNPTARSSRAPTRYARMARPSDTSVVASIKALPNKVLRVVFGYLNKEDLESCSRVCYQWKCLTDLQLRGPFVFRGKSVYGHYYSPNKCQNFVEFLLDLEPRFYRPVEMRFHHMCNSQARMIVDKLEVNFKQSVRHMESLSFVNCSFKWKTLMSLLQCYSKPLRNLLDLRSVHFSELPACLCSRYRQQIKREIGRKEFKDFKDQLKGLRRLSITRNTVTNELPVYMCILAQGTKFLDELEVNLGPYETPNPSNDTEFCNLLSLFVKELRGLIYKNKDTLKIIRFSWSDKNFTGYFSTCLDALDKMKLNHLHTISLHFDKHAMRGKSVSTLRDFVEYHYSRRLRFFKLDRMMLTESWTTTSEFLDELLDTIPPSFAGLDFKVVISDNKGPIKMSPIHQILRLEVFRRFISDIQFCIENESTKSISQMFGKEWHKKNNYPRVKSVIVTFEPGLPMKSYDHFNNFNIDLISNLFPNLTELRISDRLMEHNQIFTAVIGRKRVSGVSDAQLENKDIQLIARHLTNLRILRLWVNMSTVDDHGLTGIHRGDISILHEDDEHFSWTNFHHDVLPSFSQLQSLEEVSLRGLGPGVTDISLKFGFKNLDRLLVLDLHGKFSITKKGKQEFRRGLKSNESGTTIVRIKYRAT